MKRIAGFTILELLVVIAIIGILAALLFPVIAKSKERAYLTEDISQMRQIYVAVSLYQQDESGLLPPSLLYTKPYAKSSKVYTSPIDPYGNGIPGVADFPADLIADTGDHDSKGVPRSSFRISYQYLYPLAIFSGEDDHWIQDRMTDPGYGLISMFMYNEPSMQLGQYQVDIFRIHLANERIHMDGSYQHVEVQDGVGVGCSLNGCFGLEQR